MLTNLGLNSVSVLLGNGDGTFQSPIVSNTTALNQMLVVGDFNNDHKPDLAIVDSPYVSVLLGNGDGTFQPPSDDDSFVGPHQLTVGDFNNDHKLDVVVVGYSFGSSGFGILLGNGDGTLQPPITYPLPNPLDWVTAADFDSDGRTDIALGWYLAPGLSVFLSNGDGSFQPGVFYDTTQVADQIVASDLNGDGKLDLAVPTGEPIGITVLWGNGDGTFQPARVYQSWVSGPMVVSDFNGDRKPDVVMESFVGVITVLNTGVVSFSPTSPLAFPVQLVNTNSNSETVTLTNTGAAALSIRSLKVVGDFKVTTTCGTTVPAGATCAINVVFQPKTVGNLHGTITLQDSASSKAQIILLSGQSTPLELTPAKLNFGNERVGDTSPPQQITVTNESAAAVTLQAIQIGGINNNDFQQTNTCGSQIGRGSSCTISVTFRPLKTGARTGTVVFALSGVPNPHFVTLEGTGT